MSRLGLCASCRTTMPSKPSSISSLRLVHHLLLQQPPGTSSHAAGYSCKQNLTLSFSQLRNSSPVSQCPCLAFPLLLGPSLERPLQRNHQATNWPVHQSSAVQTTVPESHTSLPTASASGTPPQVSPFHPPGLPAQPLWTSPLSPGQPQAVPSSGYQQLSFTASQPLTQVPASICGKVQHGEYIDLSELLACAIFNTNTLG